MSSGYYCCCFHFYCIVSASYVPGTKLGARGKLRPSLLSKLLVFIRQGQRSSNRRLEIIRPRAAAEERGEKAPRPGVRGVGRGGWWAAGTLHAPDPEGRESGLSGRWAASTAGSAQGKACRASAPQRPVTCETWNMALEGLEDPACPPQIRWGGLEPVRAWCPPWPPRMVVLALPLPSVPSPACCPLRPVPKCRLPWPCLRAWPRLPWGRWRGHSEPGAPSSASPLG